ncbi:MAG: hypothetical protein J6Q02_04955, partial [Lachnospiraceae bacterium]|nr:hypothetical protein [Lachnospiraceae bacterium]
MMIRWKKHAKRISIVMLTCLLLCGCQNALYLYDEQGGSVTGGEGVTGGGNKPGKTGEVGGALFDDETIFRDVEDGTELAKILKEIVAGGQIYPVKALEAQNDFIASAVTKKGNLTISK